MKKNKLLILGLSLATTASVVSLSTIAISNQNNNSESLLSARKTISVDSNFASGSSQNNWVLGVAEDEASIASAVSGYKVYLGTDNNGVIDKKDPSNYYAEEIVPEELVFVYEGSNPASVQGVIFSIVKIVPNGEEGKITVTYRFKKNDSYSTEISKDITGFKKMSKDFGKEWITKRIADLTVEFGKQAGNPEERQVIYLKICTLKAKLLAQHKISISELNELDKLVTEDLVGNELDSNNWSEFNAIVNELNNEITAYDGGSSKLSQTYVDKQVKKLKSLKNNLTSPTAKAAADKKINALQDIVAPLQLPKYNNKGSYWVWIVFGLSVVLATIFLVWLILALTKKRNDQQVWGGGY
ncbi:Uncharacterised protein [Mycoplasmopsis californica]|uniref:Lipoprotein 17-related variable surface protein n=1 Tax=Mycoplasmopsis equigenitalium TaxID=114883 RepID=A0ABY5J0T5_9BACT|nr:lipoprotein 17-related variable surface protein [Mycoplasmopsis equigenitalium]UUD36872.1 lipoprotein 17-related variable surface protein [Mycoplasmopsis equigenitalium]VEU69833.1 Uncharacterised protein [Mycoplasmopsis californica]